MNWVNLVKLENILYLLMTILVMALTIIRQSRKQAKLHDGSNKKILKNFEKIENQNEEIIKLIEFQSSDLTRIKQEVKYLKTRVGLLENAEKQQDRQGGGTNVDS